MVRIEQNYPYTDNFETYSEGTVTLTSSNNDVCTINDTTIIGINKGICHVTYQLGEYKDVQTIIVGPDSIKEDLNGPFPIGFLIEENIVCHRLRYSVSQIVKGFIFV